MNALGLNIYSLHNFNFFCSFQSISLRLNRCFLTHAAMNETTLFLAQIMGPTLGLLGLGMLLNPRHYGKIFKTVGSEDFDMFLMPMLMISLGVVLVMKHFLWSNLAEVLVSLIGLGMLIKGAVLALFPKLYKSYVKTVFAKDSMISFAGVVWLALGASLTWAGFLA